MNSFFYPKLALVNIKKNSKFYFPYLLTCMLTSSMFYCMHMLSKDAGIAGMVGSNSVSFILMMGTIVVGIFSAIFLFYTNSFLMKRRKKEIGLYNILGMEKRHISKIMLYETLITGAVTILMGLAVGILFSKLLFLLLFKIIRFSVPLSFYVSWSSMTVTAALFFGIFFVTLLFNLLQIKLANPIDLLKGGNVGEREPKSKIIIALIGLIATGAGYYIAITTESPLMAIYLFFIAVLLVIVGTYCLFTAGSIAFLKILRKNKSYYYKTKNFTSVSGMIYRMKQNAVGLANICILSTAVLLMVSTTVALYVSMEEQLDYRYPYDISFKFNNFERHINSEAKEIIENTAVEYNMKIAGLKNYDSISFLAILEGNKFTLTVNDLNYLSAAEITLIRDEDYSRMTGNSVKLAPGEVMLYSNSDIEIRSFELLGEEYKITDCLEEFPLEKRDEFVKNVYCFVTSYEDMVKISSSYRTENDVYFISNGIGHLLSFDLEGTKEEKLQFSAVLYNRLKLWLSDRAEDPMNLQNAEDGFSYSFDSRASAEEEIRALDGGFLFLGIFLGFLFLIATVLIIYYKQISEGYDDRERYVIMQKVGMSKREIKESIKSQIIKVFFLPLVAAIIHIAAAFKMITRLLSLFNLTNVLLFAKCTAATIVVFAVIYGIVYVMTARVYYKIVQN